MSTEKILEERGKTHGDFRENAQVSQNIKGLIKERLHMQDLYIPPFMKEAIDMISHKLSRIAVGDPFEPDHWKDIAGYAELVVRGLKKELVDQEEMVRKEPGSCSLGVAEGPIRNFERKG
ncbi:MAG: hypothetical protein KBB46_03025 [Candidatus Pacebacteria bacterium]|nr:hypothetical protein [Candidatus Paceibacterota bacterium]